MLFFAGEIGLPTAASRKRQIALAMAASEAEAAAKMSASRLRAANAALQVCDPFWNFLRC
jgi:hypothetical protein